MKGFLHFHFRITYLFIFCIAIIYSACTSDFDSDGSLISDVKEIETNLDFVNQLHYSPELNIIEYLYYYNGGGVAIGDIDQDGLEDIYLTANQGPDKLFKNLGNLQFEDVSQSAGIQIDNSWSSGVSMDDINQDGYLDIYVCKVDLSKSRPSHNLLYINQGDGRFIESASELGLDFSGYSTQASFFDMDLDGDLDMYLLNHTEHSTNSYGSIEKRKIQNEISGDRLFENQDNQFIDITINAGIYSSALGYGLAVISSDFNDDAYPDIYVGNDFHENDYLYINQGDKTFKESIASWTDHTSQFTMGVDAADLNGDGKVDIFTTDMMPYDANIRLKSGSHDSEVVARIKKEFGFTKQYARNHLQINHCQNRLIDHAMATGTFASDWSWSPLIQDFNNDSYPDIFISNGIVKRPNDLDYINFINTTANNQAVDESLSEYYQRLINKMPSLPLQNIVFTQSPDGSYSDVMDSQIGSATFSNGAAYADLDLDGTLEIVSNNINAEATIISFPQHNNYVSFTLIDTTGHSAKGSKVKVYSSGSVQIREYVTTKGFQSSSSHNVHFGLGQQQRIDSVEVWWPGGIIQRVKDVEINKNHRIMKSGIKKISDIFSCSKKSPFDIQMIPFNHLENDYNDFENEPLMPRSYAKSGPATALHDFNNDGYEDIYLGGARGQAPQLVMGGPDYTFQLNAQQVFTTDAYYEDVDAALLDYNADGYQDIYVVSGGNDKNQLDKSLQDRIYINDGKANFKRLPVSLPHMNGSTIEVFDFNEDGYDDMFVGSQNIPGAFGVTPVSFILENRKALGVGIAYKAKIGMVTDAAWNDLDQDGQSELLVTGEWMGVKAFQFDGDSSFIKKDLSLDIAIGIYRNITINDLNHDDRPDIVMSNLGLNSEWRNGPVTLYLDDFDSNEFIDPVIFYAYGNQPIPFASKDALEKQIPTIKKVHNNYQSFSKVNNIQSLVNQNDDVLKAVTATELKSYILTSTSSGYRKINFPDQSQLSPINDVLWLEDFSGGSLLVCSNDQSGSHLLGLSEGFSTIIYTGLLASNSVFGKSYVVPLPVGTVVKKAFQYDNHSILLMTHNGPMYLIKVSN